MRWDGSRSPGVPILLPPDDRPPDEKEEGVRAAYGDRYERLVELKDRWDPTNRFRYNSNIPRAADGRLTRGPCSCQSLSRGVLTRHAERVSNERSEREADGIWDLLDLQPGVRVLDLACGHGRLANRLARRGAVVTGLDVTEPFIELARERDEEMAVDATYALGDMRTLEWREAFDVALNWFTSFGYFDDEENRRVLEGVHGALVSGDGS